LFQLVHLGSGESSMFAGLAGILQTAHRENPGFFGQIIELEASGIDPAELAQKLLEFGQYPGVERFRCSRDSVSTLKWGEHHFHGSNHSFASQDGGKFWITGGVGGIGLLLARHLASQGKKPLLLLSGRKDLNPQIESELQKLREQGAEVEYLRLDVTDKSAVQQAVQRMVERHGGIDGIFHCAGITRDSYILKKSADDMRAVLGPKVVGLINLDEATIGLELKYFILFSSIAGAMGNAGQSDYSTANAFMDSFALWRNRLTEDGNRRGTAISINWPLWEEGGMKVDHATETNGLKRIGLIPMRTATAMGVLNELIASKTPRAMVMEGDPVQIKQSLSTEKVSAPARAAAAVSGGGDVELSKEIISRLKALLSETIKLDVSKINPAEALEDYGMDSILISALNEKLALTFSDLPKTLWYEQQTLVSVAEYLMANFLETCRGWTGKSEGKIVEVPKLELTAGLEVAGGARHSVRAVSDDLAKTPRSQNDALRIQAAPPSHVSNSTSTEPIAIIGLSGRYPQADGLEQYWDHLLQGKNCLGQLPSKRWRWGGIELESDKNQGKSQTDFVVRGGFLDSFDTFDPLFFGIPPSEVENMDPQERLILMTCWSAMEESGHSRASLRERYQGEIGVFVGVTKSGFRLHSRLEPTFEKSRFTVTSFSSMANRISYLLNLTGPSLAIDTMCSSSLTAIHEACEHIRRGDCQLALAGGVNLYLHPRDYIDLRLGKMVTDEEEILCFSKDGKGFIPGEGVGAVLLKPLSRALADGDPIHGVIRGSAIRHGGKTHGYTVPSVTGQRALIEKTLLRSGMNPQDIGYVESAANGSGMGDAIEFEALKQVFKDCPVGSVKLGSVKPNIGHLEAASGMSQLTKVLLQMRHKTVAPTRVFADRLDPALRWAESPFSLVTKSAPWSGANDQPLRSLVTSFGAGGSYAALVVESFEGRPPESPTPSVVKELIIISARTEVQLRDGVRQLRDSLQENPVRLDSLAYTLQRGRDAMEWRLAMEVGDLLEITEVFENFLSRKEDPRIWAGRQSQFVNLTEMLSPAEIRELADKAVLNRDLASIARFWIRGFNEICWERIYSTPPARCHLPTYPFEQRSFWVEPDPVHSHASTALGPVNGVHTNGDSYHAPGGRNGTAIEETPLVEAHSGGARHSVRAVEPTQSAGSNPSASEETEATKQVQKLDRQIDSQAPVESRAEIKSRIASVIRGILLLRDEDELRDDVTFFDLGLDSITSARLIQKLGQEIGSPLPETLFFEFPTIKALSEQLAAQGVRFVSPDAATNGVRTPAPDLASKKQEALLTEKLQQAMKDFPELVPLQIEGNEPILFCIHPMSGDVGLHGKLADASQKSFRIVAIKSKGSNGGEPHPDIESMGAYDADAILAVEDQGPYFLLAPSMGGAVIHEIARQLQMRGRKVSALVLIEPPLAQNQEDSEFLSTNEADNWLMNANFILITYLHMDPGFRQRKAAGQVYWPSLEIVRSEMDGVNPDDLVSHLVGLIRKRGVTQEVSVLEGRLRSMAAVHHANLRALSAYRPKQLPTPQETRAILLRTANACAVSGDMYNPLYLVELQKARGGLDSFFLDWSRLYPHLETRVIEGRNHLDLLNTASAADQMAQLVVRVMNECRGETRNSSSEQAIQNRSGHRIETRQTPVPSKVDVQKFTGPRSSQKIAIVGMSGQFPGASNVAEFWDNLKSARTFFTPFPGDRGWEKTGSTEPAHKRSYVDKGGFLPDAVFFDAAFFGISPREAEMMDPSERVFLQESWRAVEDAGYDPQKLSGKQWGVFCGGGGDYHLLVRDLYGVAPQVTVSSFAGRVSYQLNLKGPTASLDAGCASSLLAVAHACDQLILGNCETAIAGGVQIYSTPNLIVTGCRTELFSREGRSCALDQRAGGMMPGEAAGVLVLKLLDRAVQDGDRIHAVIEGWGSNHNGRTNGLASPSAVAQSDLFCRVYRDFGIHPATLQMIEANATASKMGDAVEFQALTHAFKEFTDEKQFCVLSSVENNVGHAFAGSGMAHLLKAVLALKHQEIPACANLEQPSPLFSNPQGPFLPGNIGRKWPVIPGQSARAAVSSFGATGTNVHLVLAEFPGRNITDTDSTPTGEADALFYLSARTAESLKQRCQDILNFIDGSGGLRKFSVRQLAANLTLGKNDHTHRCAFVVRDMTGLRQILGRILKGEPVDLAFLGQAGTNISPAFLQLGEAALKSASIQSCPGQMELLNLANLYVQGFDFSGAALFSKSERFPISLPGYPFEKRRCWISLEKKEAVSRPAAPSSIPAHGVPHDSVEGVIRRLLGESTGRDVAAFGSDTPLAEFGLESLSSLRYLAAINEHFSTNLQLADLVDHHTLRALSELIAEDVAEMAPAKITAPVFKALVIEGGSWIQKRLSELPKAIHALSFSFDDVEAKNEGSPFSEGGVRHSVRATSKDGDQVRRARSDAPYLEIQTATVLNRLLKSGLAIFVEQDRAHFFAQSATDISAALGEIDSREMQSFLGALPKEQLFAPVSEEQQRNLYHSEVLRSSAWNLQHTFQLLLGRLDVERLNQALAVVIEGHDLLRTCYLPSNETWIQLVSPSVTWKLEQVSAASLVEFQGIVMRERCQLLDVQKLPVFRLLLAEVKGEWCLGFVTHHSLADAFTSSMLISDLIRCYEMLEKGQAPSLQQIPGQYWHYSLEQFNPAIFQSGSSAGYWGAKLTGTEMSNPLPFRVEPRELSRELRDVAQAQVFSITPEETARIIQFARENETTFTQLFTSAIAILSTRFLKTDRAVFTYANNQRDQWRWLKTAGEFTRFLLLPIPVDPDQTLLEVVRSVKSEVVEGLRHGKFAFAEMLALTSLHDLDGFYGQTGDIMIDTVDLDAVSSDSMEKKCRSISSDVWTDPRASQIEGQALTTWFFQAVKVGGRIHLIVSYRKHLFDFELMQSVGSLVFELVNQIIANPDRKVGALASSLSPAFDLRKTIAASDISAFQKQGTASKPRKTRRGGAQLPGECQALNRVKEGRPIFWIHAGLGGVDGYQSIAQKIKRPFYGINARGSQSDEAAISGLHSMAAFYLRVMRSVQPEGPYDLGGYSLGGLLAYEMTRLAQLERCSVESIVMLDTLDSAGLKRIKISHKTDMLQTVNTALLVHAAKHSGKESEIMIHQNQVDPALEEERFLDQLILIARQRGLVFSVNQLRDLIRRRSKVQQAYDHQQFELLPLSDPNSVRCYYFRNRSGSFLGALQPYYTLPGEEVDLDGVNYWHQWTEQLPHFRMIDVESTSHITMLSEPLVQRSVLAVCGKIYCSAGDLVSTDGPVKSDR